MQVAIDSADARSLKAVEIAAGAGQWLKVRTRDGRKWYGIPSERIPARYYLVTILGACGGIQTPEDAGSDAALDTKHDVHEAAAACGPPHCCCCQCRWRHSVGLRRIAPSI